MIGVILRRVAIGVPVIIGVSAIIFFVLRVLPGDPVLAITQGTPTTPAERHDIIVEFGLDKPLWSQYLSYLGGAVRGNFGVSFQTRQPVVTEISQQAGATVELAIAAMLMTVVFGVGLGVVSALLRDTWVDHAIRVLSLLGSSMPIIWSGPLLILVFSFTLRIFPANGSGSLSQLVLPAAAIALAISGVIIRLVRTSMLEVLNLEFVTALRAKGVAEPRIWLRHVLRNALVPAVTLLGVQLGGLLSGAVIAETVFGRQGLGSLLVNGIENKDYPMVQATVLIVATAYVAINIVVDISYAYLDPRVRTELAGQGR
jgi:ABC-type dipeptide/oligopeptide/nickel transport system permease component